MTKREERLRIESYEEFDKRREEFRGIKIDKELFDNISKMFPKASNTKEELFKIPPNQGGRIGG